MKDTVKYRGQELAVACVHNSTYTLLESEYLMEFETVGIDTEGSRLRTEYVPGEGVGYIIDAETGCGVGFCDILEADPDLVV